MAERRQNEDWFVWACPECGAQALHHEYDPETRPTTYCLGHEADGAKGRIDRPAHVRVPVRRRPKRLTEEDWNAS